jgi:desumoylating isopeptidase 1
MTETSGERVFLYIYDLSRGLARSLSPSLIGRQIDGIWHTSVVSYGHEFYYGQGIFVTDRVGRTQYGTPVEIKDMGVTELPQEVPLATMLTQVFIEYIDSLRGIYTAEKYHLLDNNCNTFTNDVCQVSLSVVMLMKFLVGKTIPGHISSLPEDFLNTPFGQSLRPMIDGAFSAPQQSLPQQSFSQPLPPSYSQAQSTSSIPPAQSQAKVHYPTTTTEFDSLISSSNMAIAFFTSETCGPCKMIEPHYHSLSKTYTNITFLQIDTQRAFPISRTHQITATPTFKTFINGALHSEWKGATPTALDDNLARLIDAARPMLPPTLRGTYGQSPILFPRAPPMQKVLPNIPAKVIPKPLVGSISAFLSAKDSTEVLVPPLVAWAKVIRELDYDVENAWMVVDLLRAAMADKRVSGWFAVDGLDVLKSITSTVTQQRADSEWQLRVVTVQLVFP